MTDSTGPPIGPFRGEYFFLSNFYPATIKAQALMWPTAEHLYQALKTVDQGEREVIHRAPTPGQAKYLGRHVTIRGDWDAVKLQVMRWTLSQKFNQHPQLAAQLLATGDRALVEINRWHDNYWGVCVCPRCRERSGENHLGRLLMQLRAQLRRGPLPEEVPIR